MLANGTPKCVTNSDTRHKTEDDTTGLLATDNRYYDPTLARFISVDPLTDLANPQTLNPYTYSANNPVTYSDPSGLAPCATNTCAIGGTPIGSAGGSPTPVSAPANPGSATEGEPSPEDTAEAAHFMYTNPEDAMAALAGVGPTRATCAGGTFVSGHGCFIGGGEADPVDFIGIALGPERDCLQHGGGSCAVAGLTFLPVIGKLLSLTGRAVVRAGRLVSGLSRTLRSTSTLTGQVKTILAAKAGTGALRPLSQVERSTLDDALRPAKLDHIFDPKHNFDPLVQQFGSREAVVEQFVRNIGGPLPAAGRFEIARDIGGQTVVIRGAVVNGVPRLGTAFTP